jgi:hypothetical protein
MALAIGFLTFGGELLDPRLQALMLVFSILPKTSAFTLSASRIAARKVASAS